MQISGLILLAMIPAMALTLIHFGLGPFSHPKLFYVHQRYQKISGKIKLSIQSVCGLVFLAGILILLGVIPTSSV